MFEVNGFVHKLMYDHKFVGCAFMCCYIFSVMFSQQSGLLAKWQDIYLPEKPNKDTTPRPTTPPAISLTTLAGLFEIFSAMLVLSAGIFMAEFYTRKNT